MFGSHHIYEKTLDDGARIWIHVRGDGGAPRALLPLYGDCDPLSASVLEHVGVDALERAIDEQTLGALPAYLTAWCGISPGERVRRSRGRPEQWTDEQLRELVQAVLARQEAGENPTDLHGVQPWCLSSKRVRELLRKAEARGFVTIIPRPGRSNVYAAPPE